MIKRRMEGPEIFGNFQVFGARNIEKFGNLEAEMGELGKKGLQK